MTRLYVDYDAAPSIRMPLWRLFVGDLREWGLRTAIHNVVWLWRRGVRW